jgi:hypothetical protein
MTIDGDKATIADDLMRIVNEYGAFPAFAPGRDINGMQETGGSNPPSSTIGFGPRGRPVSSPRSAGSRHSPVAPKARVDFEPDLVPPHCAHRP